MAWYGENRSEPYGSVKLIPRFACASRVRVLRGLAGWHRLLLLPKLALPSRTVEVRPMLSRVSVRLRCPMAATSQTSCRVADCEFNNEVGHPTGRATLASCHACESEAPKAPGRLPLYP